VIWFGVLGFFENICVCSIFGCFFEYLWVFLFGGFECELVDIVCWIGSVDMMYCNFDCCVEVLVCLEDFVYVVELCGLFDIVMDDGMFLFYFGFDGFWICYYCVDDGMLLFDL